MVRAMAAAATPKAATKWNEVRLVTSSPDLGFGTA
jgi:hypothetical protein